MNKKYENPFAVFIEEDDDCTSSSESLLPDDHITMIQVYRRSNCRCAEDSDGDDVGCPHVIETSYCGFFRNAHLSKMLADFAFDNRNLHHAEQRDLFALMERPKLSQFLKRDSPVAIVFHSEKQANGMRHHEISHRQNAGSKKSAQQRAYAKRVFDGLVDHYYALLRLRDDDCFLTREESAAMAIRQDERIVRQYTVYCVNNVVYVI